MSTNHGTPLGTAVICTALDVEYAAVREHVEGPFTEREERGTLYEIGTFTTDCGRWTVVLAQTGAGNTQAGVQLERAISVFRPQIVLFVGVAGGRKDVALGDVVIADAIYDYESGKDTATDYLPRIKTTTPSHRLVQRANAVARQAQWLYRILPAAPDMPPRAVIKPIAAGGKIIANQHARTAQFLHRHCGDAVAVEMEGHGFLHGAYVNNAVDALVVRGISDLLSGKTEIADQHWQPLAARHAAAFAFELLACHTPPPTPQTETSSGVVARQLPPLVARLVGRKHELEVLLSILGPESSTGFVVVSAVAGMAGVGKTALAVKAAHDAVDHGWFPGGVLFLDLCGYDQVPISSAQALDSLLRGLGVPGEEIPPETADRVGLYRSVLAGLTGSVLVVLDNASAAEQVRPLLPGDARHRVLVTSRHSLAQLGARLLELGVFPEEDAVGLLDTAVRMANPSDNRIAEELSWSKQVARYCGHLPLALQIAAALLMFDPTKPVAELAADLAEAHTRLDHLDDGERAVRAAFDLSYQRLPPDQARLFRLLAVHPGPDVATGTVAVLADRDESVARRMLDELARAHLIEPAPIRGRWRMHDLIRIYAEQATSRHAPADERQQARDRLCDFLLYLADAADDHLKALPDTPVPVEFNSREEALAWFDTERTTLTAVTSMAADHGCDDIAHHLPARLIEYFRWRRHLDDWLTTAVISRQAAARLRDPRLEAIALANYGDILREVRRFPEAVDACQTAVALTRKIKDRYGEAAALGNLGVALRHAGQVDEAVRICYQALDAQRELGDQRGEAFALNNLGNALQQAGRPDEVVNIHREHLELCRRTGDRTGEAMALIGLGNVFHCSGHSQMSIEPYEAALAICRETENVRMQSLLLNNLGGALQQLGRIQEALAIHQDDLAICQKAQDLPGQGRALVGVASAFIELGDLNEALATCQRAIEVARVSGRRDIEGFGLATLTTIHVALRRWKQAITTCRQAADICHQTGERRHEAIARYNLGHVLQQSSDPEEAVQAYSEAVSLFRTIGDCYGEALALNARGSTFIDMERAEQAQRDHKKALTISRKIGNRLIEGRSLTGLGNALLIARRSQDAVIILRQAVAIARQNDDREVAILALCHLGSALLNIGRGDEAFMALEDAAELDPDADIQEILYLGTQGKVRSLSRFILETVAAAGPARRADYANFPQRRRKRAKRTRHKRRR